MTTAQRVNSIVSSINRVSELVSKTVVDTELVSQVHELYMLAMPIIGDDRLKPLLDSLEGGTTRTIEGSAELVTLVGAIMTQVRFVNASKIVAGVSKALTSGDSAEISSACNNLTKAAGMLTSNRSVKMDSMLMSKESVTRLAPILKYNTDLRTPSVFDTWANPQVGDLTIILAPPGVGKTTALVYIGREMAMLKKGAVFHFSLEIGMAPLVNKYMTGWSKYNNEQVFAYYAPALSMTTDLIKSRVEADSAANGVKPVCVIVDHLSHLSSVVTNNTSSKFDKVSDNVIRLKSLSYELGCPIFTAAQPQRSPVRDMRSVPSKGAGGYCLGMQDVAECWAIPQVADNLLSINQTDDERDNIPIKARIHNAKTRLPRPGGSLRNTFEVTIDYARCDFVPDGGLL